MSSRTIHSFFEALTERRFDDLEAMLTESVSFEFPGRRFGGTFEGRRRFLVFAKQNQRLFRDGLKFRLQDVLVDGARGVAQWTNRGTTQDGVDYRNRGVTVFHFTADGRIERLQDYLDTELLSSTWPQ